MTIRARALCLLGVTAATISFVAYARAPAFADGGPCPELISVAATGRGRPVPLVHNPALFRCQLVADLSPSLRSVLLTQEYSRLYIAPTVGHARRKITQNSVRARARFSPDGMKVVFEDQDNLYVVAATGGTPVKISDAATRASWSPDSRRLAFIGRYVMTIHGAETGVLTVANADGSSRRELANWWGSTSNPASVWDPTGNWIAFTTGPPGPSLASLPDLHIVSVDGSHERTIRTADAPTWSPDGKRFAFLAGRPTLQSLRVQAPEGGRVRVLARDAGGPPAWSPTGRVIAYPERIGGHLGFGGRLAIAAIRPDGTHRRLLTLNREQVRSIDRIFWAANGRRLAFLRERDIG